MDPPPCVQNAMMTKDKKPFTYTPGGIDLSEVRSPRMQRRIERNANLGGADDMPKPPQPHSQNVGPLPPSALAVMRPQTQVQVFPGPPPAPPMQKNIPPPPPPPTCPLPTQKITTSDNQVLERPDMTKIIPDNPMALLRKTGGPAPRKSLVDQIFEEQNKSPPTTPPQRNFEAQSPRYQPSAEPVSAPIQQQRQPQAYQPAPQKFQPPSSPQQQYQPCSYQPVQPSQSQYQPVQSPQPQYQPVQVQQRLTDSPQPSVYQPPIIERQPTIARQEPTQKNVSSSIGSLYIPPLNQQQQSPPTPPERNHPQVQSPGTLPTLKEAPRPWQQKNAQQELPPWARREDVEQVQAQSPPSVINMQQRWQPQGSAPQPQQAPPQTIRQQVPNHQFSTKPQPQQSPRSGPEPYASNSFPVHIEIHTGPYQQEPEPSEQKPNAVYVTQPIVLHHPGPMIEPPYKAPQPAQQQYQQQQQQHQTRQVQQKTTKVESSGTRIVPIQIEGRTTPSTPGGERNLNRQLSWSSQPLQSNSFKIIQKFTRTDDDEDDDTPITQHSPRYTQEMPEQVRRMKINDNGHFGQAHQQNNAGRNMSVQVEDNGQPQPYVHPSEQVVPEPKKYMGSNIPSRSFKILQAMTAPTDNCANANYNEEPPYNPIYNSYGYPYYPLPYWSEYYTNFYPPEQSELVKNVEKKSGLSTPLPAHAMPYPQPYWQDYYPSNYPQEQSDSTSKMSDRSSKSSTKSGRSTPLPTAIPLPPPLPPPFWRCMPPPSPYIGPRCSIPKSENILRPQTQKTANEYQIPNSEELYHYPMCPPYFDPYYYSYYYGYPPVMPPYPYYPTATESEEYSGYSSMDEMSNCNTSRRSSLKRRNSLDNSTNSVQSLKQHFEVRSKSAAPRITITPTYFQENISSTIPPDKAKDDENGESENEIQEVIEGHNLYKLRSIESVHNINIYTNSDCTGDTETSESDESSDEETEEEISVELDGSEIIPHQLSVIYEESERGESRSFRSNSVASESTTIAEHHSEEEEDFLSYQNVKYKINLFQENNERITTKAVEKKNIRAFEEDTESFAFAKLSINCKLKKTTIKDQWFDEIQNNINTDKHLNKEYLNGEKKYESICIEPKEIVTNHTKEEENASNENTMVSVNKEKSKETEEDWWGVIKNASDKSLTQNKESCIIPDENVCDNVNSNDHSVMVEVEDEIICVKLRNKNKNISNDLDISESNNITKENDNLFLASVSQRSSIYDALKNNEEDEEEMVTGRTLMRVDSFASQLEAIKRNSGLWNFEENTLNNPANVIREESINTELIDNGEENEETNVKFEVIKLTDNSANEIKEKIFEPETFYSDVCSMRNDVEVEEDTSIIGKNIPNKEDIEKLTNQDEVGDEIDFWSQIKNDEDDFTPRRKIYYLNEDVKTDIAVETVNLKQEDEKNDSASSINSSCSKSRSVEEPEVSANTDLHIYNLTYQNTEEKDDSSREESEADSSADEHEKQKINNNLEHDNRSNNSRSRSLEPQTIKERIEALRNSVVQKRRIVSEKEDITTSVKSKISAIEIPSDSRSKTTSTKSSIRSFEEYSEEEELDSGVISDISRHISDNEEFPELRKLTKYERAATHSRLFKLLQDECDIEEEEEQDDVFVKKEDKFSKLSVRQNRGENKVSHSRSKLNLTLNKCNESDEKNPQINEKLADELVQSLLKSKKAQMLKNMSKEKLHAAARTILQEGVENGDTPSEEFSSLLSPLRGNTETSTPAQTPQEFYGIDEYKEYYDSWSDAAVEIMPSRTFKLLHEHIGNNKFGSMEGILAKCPRILSSKNVPTEISKLLDEHSSDCPATPSQIIPQSNDVTNT